MSKTAEFINKYATLAGHRSGRPHVSAQVVAAETEHQVSGAQREPRRNVNPV
jgi:hypothetical protein